MNLREDIIDYSKRETLSRDILSEITVYGKYARFLPAANRRETWEEIVLRNMDMHIKKFPHLADEIAEAYTYVLSKKVFPSMRSLQFGGLPIELSPNRMFNCAYTACNHIAVFSETMFLLLGGSGVGYSVQKHDVEELPELQGPKSRKRRYLVGDSIEGWADAIKILMESYFDHRSTIEFDYRDIRPKGALLVTSGGKAPGPVPLKMCIEHIRMKLDSVLADRGAGTQLRPIEVHDIMCHIADAVLAGGIRRAALISLFSFDDQEMMSSKSGQWWEENPQRGRANNSVVLVRHKVKKEDFMHVWSHVEASKAGEPGIFFTNDKNIGCNPCCLSGDNELLTKDGYFKIKDLSGKTLELKNKFGEVVQGKVWETGEKEVFEIKAGNTKDPYIIKATFDHVFSDVDGNEVQTKDIKGKRLDPFYQLKSVDRDSLELRYGFVLGDGTFRESDNNFTNVECSFTPIKDAEIQSLFVKTGTSKDKSRYTINVSYEELKSYGIDTSLKTYERKLPEVVTEDFLTGLYSANGSVTGGRVTYKTTSKDVRDKLIETLESFGIVCYYTTNKAKAVEWSNGTYTSRESYDINISSLKSILIFADKISFIQTYKQDDLVYLIRDKAPYVYSVKSLGLEKVYDFALFDDTHWGVVNGIVTHNCEISLKPNSFCNLTTINVSDVKTQEDLNARVRAATIIGTLQASYTNFHYLRDVWRRNTEKEALLGVSMTGIASGNVQKLNVEESSKLIVDVNKWFAKLIGINAAYRSGCIKPEGTSSCVAGTGSGIHARHAEFYIRRMRLGKDEALYSYLNEKIPALLEDEFFKPKKQAVLSIPVKSPRGSILRTESPIDLLERVKYFHDNWIQPAHVKGSNTHNVSVTVSIKDDEWTSVGEWMWVNRASYNGISVLPYDGGSYIQAPFEECTEEHYYNMLKHVKDIDVSEIIEQHDTTDLSGEVACGGSGSCEIQSI